MWKIDIIMGSHWIKHGWAHSKKTLDRELKKLLDLGYSPDTIFVTNLPGDEKPRDYRYLGELNAQGNN